MADELTPGQVRTRRFDVVRKGYDREQVDDFLSDVARDLDRLERAATEMSDKDLAIGIDDFEALALELHTIGSDVATILESARSASEGMRARATADADEWRTTAEATSTDLLESAGEQSQSMRASAWNEGASLLSSAAAEAESLIAEAKEDALFVRAEAEREAIRLTGDAKRDREETIRAARMESDQILESARNESDGVLAAANQQAELAQERAKALEDRRTELLAELEGARASIGQLESEIEDKRQELETPLVVPESIETGRTHHSTDSGSVKIVSASKVVALAPVDADEFVAEVEALRNGEDEAAPAPAAEPVVETVAVIVPPSPSPSPPVAEPVVEDASPVPDTEEIQLIEAAAVPDTEPVSPEPTEDAEPPQAAGALESIEEAPSGDTIGSLFAQLRDEPQDESNETPMVASPPAVAEPEPVVESTPQSVAQPPAPSEPHDDEHSADAALIPLQNAALRSIKRALVDLQNEALEELRADPKWVPDAEFTDRFVDPFSELSMELAGKKDASTGRAFGADLSVAVNSAVEKTRASGAGEREVASAMSKVFRMWRSDEAERRVVDAAQGLHVSA